MFKGPYLHIYTLTISLLLGIGCRAAEQSGAGVLPIKAAFILVTPLPATRELVSVTPSSIPTVTFLTLPVSSVTPVAPDLIKATSTSLSQDVPVTATLDAEAGTGSISTAQPTGLPPATVAVSQPQEVIPSATSQLVDEQPSIVIGSYGTTEQLLLAQMSLLMLEDVGYPVTTMNISGFNRRSEALRERGVDVAWAYVEAASSAETDASSAESQVVSLDQDLEFVWLPASQVNNQYVLLAGETAVSANILSLADLANQFKDGKPSLTFCMENEFYGRNEGLEALQQFYDFSLPGTHIKLVAYEQLFEQVRNGRCDIAAVRAVDSRISAWQLQPLTDADHVFAATSATQLVHQEIQESYPEIIPLLTKLNEQLNTDLLTQLAAQVDIGPDEIGYSGDEIAIRSAAELFLCQLNLIENCPLSTHESNENTCTNIIINGDFETDEAWNIVAIGPQPDYSTFIAHTGQQSVRLGGSARDVGSHSNISQQITIPAEAVTATMDFWYYPISHDLAGEDVQGAAIFDKAFNTRRQQLLLRVSNQRVWIHVNYDVSDFIGETLFLNFFVVNDGEDGESLMFLDDMRLDVCSASALTE